METKINREKEEIKNLLEEAYSGYSVYQTKADRVNEYHLIRLNGTYIDTKFVEVVDTYRAIEKESDCSGAKSFLLNVIEALLNGKKFSKIGAYSRLCDDLYWKEF